MLNKSDLFLAKVEVNMATNLLTPPVADTVRPTVSYETYLKTSPETAITEWVEGEVITYMPPIRRHQTVLDFLSYLINTLIQLRNLGQVVTAPFEVKLWPDGPSREPDLIFVSQENLDKLDEKRFNGAPDLVVEIVSPSSVREDKIRKFQEYERAGVREYWLIDPRPHLQTVEIFALNEMGEYEPVPVTEDGVVHTAVLPGFWLNVNWFTQTPLPKAQRIAYEIMLTLDGLPPAIRTAYQTLHDALAD